MEKGKGFPYSLPSVEHGADPGVQAVSPQVIISHPGGRLALLSARPAVTFPAAEHQRPLAGTKLNLCCMLLLCWVQFLYYQAKIVEETVSNMTYSVSSKTQNILNTIYDQTRP